MWQTVVLLGLASKQIRIFYKMLNYSVKQTDKVESIKHTNTLSLFSHLTSTSAGLPHLGLALHGEKTTAFVTNSLMIPHSEQAVRVGRRRRSEEKNEVRKKERRSQCTDGTRCQWCGPGSWSSWTAGWQHDEPIQTYPEALLAWSLPGKPGTRSLPRGPWQAEPHCRAETTVRAPRAAAKTRLCFHRKF